MGVFPVRASGTAGPVVMATPAKLALRCARAQASLAFLCLSDNKVSLRVTTEYQPIEIVPEARAHAGSRPTDGRPGGLTAKTQDQ